jgi:hypothetical protein
MNMPDIWNDVTKSATDAYMDALYAPLNEYVD